MSRTCYNSLWIGPRLGVVERACLLSVLRQGHRLRLWCYAKPDGVPLGVEIADAATVLPAESIVRHRNGSPSLFSNRFRYELQRRALGPWIDADVYLLRPIPDRSYLFAYENEWKINPSVLRLPSDSPLIPPLLAIFEERTIPPWISWRARHRARWRLIMTGRTGLSHMPWGSAGPMALTALARQHGLEALALPAALFHPVPWRQAAWLLEPDKKLEDVVVQETIGIHLWNERIKHIKEGPAPPGSFLARLQAESAAAP